MSKIAVTDFRFLFTKDQTNIFHSSDKKKKKINSRNKSCKHFYGSDLRVIISFYVYLLRRLIIKFNSVS